MDAESNDLWSVAVTGDSSLSFGAPSVLFSTFVKSGAGQFSPSRNYRDAARLQRFASLTVPVVVRISPAWAVSLQTSSATSNSIRMGLPPSRTVTFGT